MNEEQMRNFVNATPWKGCPTCGNTPVCKECNYCWHGDCYDKAVKEEGHHCNYCSSERERTAFEKELSALQSKADALEETLKKMEAIFDRIDCLIYGNSDIVAECETCKEVYKCCRALAEWRKE